MQLAICYWFSSLISACYCQSPIIVICWHSGCHVVKSLIWRIHFNGNGHGRNMKLLKKNLLTLGANIIDIVAFDTFTPFTMNIEHEYDEHWQLAHPSQLPQISVDIFTFPATSQFRLQKSIGLPQKRVQKIIFFCVIFFIFRREKKHEQRVFSQKKCRVFTLLSSALDFFSC